MAEDLKYDLKIDGLNVYINWRGNAAATLAKHVRSKHNIEKGSIVDLISTMFKCKIEKDLSATIYVLTFNSERDMMYFILHT